MTYIWARSRVQDQIVGFVLQLITGAGLSIATLASALPPPRRCSASGSSTCCSALNNGTWRFCDGCRQISDTGVKCELLGVDCWAAGLVQGGPRGSTVASCYNARDVALATPPDGSSLAGCVVGHKNLVQAQAASSLKHGAALQEHVLNTSAGTAYTIPCLWGSRVICGPDVQPASMRRD